MTDMPGWRSWADKVHAASLRPRKNSKNPRFRCSNKSCNHTTTKNHAKKNGNSCFSCKAPLNQNPILS